MSRTYSRRSASLAGRWSVDSLFGERFWWVLLGLVWIKLVFCYSSWFGWVKFGLKVVFGWAVCGVERWAAKGYERLLRNTKKTSKTYHFKSPTNQEYVSARPSKTASTSTSQPIPTYQRLGSFSGVVVVVDSIAREGAELSLAQQEEEVLSKGSREHGCFYEVYM